MMKRWYIWIWVLLGMVLLAGLAALLLEPLGQQWGARFAEVFCYLAILAGVWVLLQQFVGNKLHTLPPMQQWVFRTVIYAGTLLSTLWAVYLLQMFLFFPWPEVQDSLHRHLWVELGRILSRPFNPGTSDVFADPRWQSVGAALLFLSLGVAVVSILISYVQLRWQESHHRQLRQQAELTALRAQMNPHFLFNTLNTIASFIHQDPSRAERLLVQLSDLFRYLFQHAGQDTVALEKELSFARRYVELLQARFADRIQVHWQVDPSLSDVAVPGLLFQPLIENAIQHGWRDRHKPLNIWISVCQDGQGVRIVVRDDGFGFDPSQKHPLKRNNHALSILAERLRLVYGNRNLLSIHSRPGEGTEVAIQIPERLAP